MMMTGDCVGVAVMTMTTGVGVGVDVGVRVGVGVGTGVGAGDIGEEEDVRGVTKGVGDAANSGTVPGVVAAPGSSVPNLSHAARSISRRAEPTIRPTKGRFASKIACTRFLPTHLSARMIS